MQNTLTPWSTIGYITYKRTYSRRLNETDINSPTEEFEDTVNYLFPEEERLQIA